MERLLKDYIIYYFKYIQVFNINVLNKCVYIINTVLVIYARVNMAFLHSSKLHVSKTSSICHMIDFCLESL